MKKLLIGLLAACLVLGLVACSGQDDAAAPSEPETQVTTEQPTETVVTETQPTEDTTGEQAAVCAELIDQIGEVSLEKKDQIQEVRAAYDALPAEEQALVTNYDVLTAAEAALEALEHVPEALSVGQTVVSDNWEGTLQKAGLVDAIYPSDLSGQYNYYTAGDGSVFLALEFDVKNLNTETLAFYDFANNIVVSYGDYKYNNYEMFYDMGSSISVTMLKGEYLGPAPLDLTRLYIVFSLPKEVETGDLPVSVVLNVAGAERIIQIRQ